MRRLFRVDSFEESCINLFLTTIYSDFGLCRPAELRGEEGGFRLSPTFRRTRPRHRYVVSRDYFELLSVCIGVLEYRSTSGNVSSSGFPSKREDSSRN